MIDSDTSCQISQELRDFREFSVCSSQKKTFFSCFVRNLIVLFLELSSLKTLTTTLTHFQTLSNFFQLSKTSSYTMALQTMDLENLNTLNTDEKVVQMTDMIQIQGETLTKLLTRIEELEAEVARLGAIEDDDKTLAMDSADVANMADVAEVAEQDPGTPKKPETPKKKSPKKSQPKKEKKEKPSCEELSMLGFDVTKCRRRIYNQGWGCQCQKGVFENGLCKVDYLALYGDNAKETKTASPEKETFAHGYADELRPDANPITGDAHRWRDINGEFPAKKGKKASPKTDSPKKEKGEKKSPSVSELREAISALAPEKDLKGMKKKELTDLLESLQKPQEVPEVEEGVPVAVAEAVQEVEEVAQPPADLEEEIGDDLGEYIDVEFQGVDYLVKDDKLFNGNFEEIGMWDSDTKVATFTTDEAKDKHLAEKDSDDEDNAE